MASLLLPGANGRIFDVLRPGAAGTYAAITAGEMTAGRATSNTSTGTGTIDMPGICQSQKFSRVAVVRVNSLSTANVISGSRNSAENGSALWRILSSGEIDLVKGQVVQLGVTSGAGLTAGVEATIGVTYDGTTFRFFKNGVRIGTGTSTQTFTIDASGRLFGAGGSGSWFNGLLGLHADFDRALDEAQMRALTANPWQLLHGATRRRKKIASGATLSIADTSHAHAADALTLTQVHALDVAEALHGHSAEALTLAVGAVLTAADATHGHLVDSPALTQAHAIAIAEALHAHTAEAVVLTQAHLLAIADAAHVHRADGITLGATGMLAIADALHPHLADALVLGQAHILAISDAAHAHLADVLSLALPGAVWVGDRVLYIQAERRVLAIVAESRWLAIAAERRLLTIH